MYNAAISSYSRNVSAFNAAKNNAVQQNSPNNKDETNIGKYDSFAESYSSDEKEIGSYAQLVKHTAAHSAISKAESAKKAEKKIVNLVNGEEIDEKKLKELQDAYDYFRKAAASNGYSVVKSSGGDGYSYCIRSGKKSVIMIDPEFMNSIKDNPEALKKYADEIETMKRLDKQFERQAKQQGKTVVSRGWRIEKDGSISSWSVTKTVRKSDKGHLQLMNEMRDKILKKKMKKKKEDAAIQEKRSKRREEQLRLEGRKRAAAKENIKRKIKKVRVYDLTRLTPKKYPGSGKSVSVSISSGRSPSLLTDSSKK